MLAKTLVVIAGAGPVGCSLALSLARFKIPVLLLEKENELPVDLRASTFHPPSLEMLNEVGLAESMIEKGLRVNNYQYRDRRSNQVANFDMQLIADETPFPFRLQLEQYEMTRLAVNKLKQFPHVDIRFGHEVIAVENRGDRAVCVVRHNGLTTEIDADFVVGTDGASSQVRKSAGIDFGGFTYNEKFLVASTDYPFESVFPGLSYVNYISDPDEWCVLLRTEKRWRVLFPTTPENAEDEHYLLSDEFIEARLQHLYRKDEDYSVFHRTLYRVHQRVAETYVKGRIILAGDACHINNPLGGMGMNGGIHDAMNLGVKLKNCLLDNADYKDQLALYDRQRRDLAVRFVQNHTIENKKLMEATDSKAQEARQTMLMEAASDPVKAKAFLMERAMINCVRESLRVK